jgi:hypothetical protein
MLAPMARRVATQRRGRGALSPMAGTGRTERRSAAEGAPAARDMAFKGVADIGNMRAWEPTSGRSLICIAKGRGSESEVYDSRLGMNRDGDATRGIQHRAGNLGSAWLVF